MLGYAMLGKAMVCYAMLCDAMLFYALPHYLIQSDNVIVVGELALRSCSVTLSVTLP